MVEVRLVGKLIQGTAEYSIGPAPGRAGAAEGRKQDQGLSYEFLLRSRTDYGLHS